MLTTIPSIGNRLTKIRAKIFVKQSLMLTNLRTYAGFQKFEIPLGGRFPKEQYDRLIESISRYVCEAIAMLTRSSYNARQYNPIRRPPVLQLRGAH